MWPATMLDCWCIQLIVAFAVVCVNCYVTPIKLMSCFWQSRLWTVFRQVIDLETFHSKFENSNRISWLNWSFAKTVCLVELTCVSYRKSNQTKSVLLINQILHFRMFFCDIELFGWLIWTLKNTFYFTRKHNTNNKTVFYSKILSVVTWPTDDKAKAMRLKQIKTHNKIHRQKNPKPVFVCFACQSQLIFCAGLERWLKYVLNGVRCEVGLHLNSFESRYDAFGWFQLGWRSWFIGFEMRALWRLLWNMTRVI